MKKFYLLALSLLSVAAASAQTLTLYHNEGTEDEPNYVEFASGSTITVANTEVSGDAVHGYIYQFDSGIAISGTKTAKVIYEATKDGEFIGCGDIDENPRNYAYQICPLGTCVDALNSGNSATGEFYASDEIVDLAIHYGTGENTSADDAPIGYAKVNYVIYYKSDKSTAVTFTLVFDNDPSHAGVSNITVDNSNAPVEYFNLNGTRVSADNLTPGLYIRRQGTTATKHLVK